MKTRKALFQLLKRKERVAWLERNLKIYVRPPPAHRLR